MNWNVKKIGSATALSLVAITTMLSADARRSSECDCEFALIAAARILSQRSC